LLNNDDIEKLFLCTYIKNGSAVLIIKTEFEISRIFPQQLIQLLKSIGAGIESGIKLTQVKSDCSEISPTVLLNSHIKSAFEKRKRINPWSIIDFLLAG
jgi:hypothetical protein